jgi:hypothetical protein
MPRIFSGWGKIFVTAKNASDFPRVAGKIFASLDELEDR